MPQTQRARAVPRAREFPATGRLLVNPELARSWLSGVDIQVPPLRERREDIADLITHFLARHRSTRPLSLSEGAMDALRVYDWPGNVRELERIIERVVALARSNQIELDDLPPQVRGQYREVLAPALAAGDSMRAWASRYARLMFERCGRNKREASRLLNISYHTLDAYLKYGSPRSRPPGKRVPGWARQQAQQSQPLP